MKLINKIFCTAVLLAGWTACTNEAEGVMNEAVKDTELNFQLAVDQLQSRASHADVSTINEFAIKIKNKNADPDIANKYSYENVRVSKVDGKWVSDKTIYLHGNDALDIITISPCVFKNFENRAAIPRQDKKTYQSDLLTSQRLGITPNSTDTSKEMYFQDNKLVIKMKHLLAQLTLVLKIDASMNLTEADLQNNNSLLTIQDALRFYDYRYSEGAGWQLEFASDYAQECYPYLDAVDNAEKVTQATYKCILSPGQKIYMELNIGGKQFIWEDTEDKLQLTGGQNTTLTLQISPKKEETQTASVSRSAWVE